MFKLPQEVKDGIKDYKASLDDLTSGRIKPARFVGVRVPWGFYSHRGGQVFMSRVRIPAGAVTGRQLEAIAEASRQFGNSSLHITTRQDIQIHGVKIEDTIKVIEYLKDFELSPRGGGGNTVRNVMACTLSGICPHEVFDVRGNAVALTEYLLRQENSYNLPRKFKVAFSGCAKDCAGGLVNDVGLFAVVRDGRRGYRVFAGGGMGRDSRTGHLLEEFVPEEDLGFCVEAVKRVFFKYGDRKNKHHNRLRFFIADKGFDAFRQLYQKEVSALKKDEHLALRRVEFPHRAPRVPATFEIPEAKEDADYQAFLRVSVREQKQAGLVSVELRIPRGDLVAGDLSKLAALEKDFSGLEFRTSPEQNFTLCNVEKKDARRLYLKVKEILSDFLYPATLNDVVCCKGAMTCNLGLCNSPGLAPVLEKMIAENFRGRKKVLETLDIRFNGCPNACGQHPLGKISFYGMVKKVDNRPVPFYKFLLGGRKAAERTKLAQEIGILAARHVPSFLKEFLESVELTLKDGEDIYEFLEGSGRQIALDVLNKYAYVPSYAENKDFYVDWGKQEEFTLEGMGPGECGAGVLDIIDSDLLESRIALDGAEKEAYAASGIRRSLFLSARALLVVRGQEPKTEEETLSVFCEKFVAEGIASSDYAGLREVFSATTDTLSFEERKRKFSTATEFLSHVNELYKAMDPTFNFPKRMISEAPAAAKPDDRALLLDLKGSPCPINYVKTKLFLENLNIGDIVDVLLDEGAPIQNVPKSLENDGQKILKVTQEGVFYRVTVKKAA